MIEVIKRRAGERLDHVRDSLADNRLTPFCRMMAERVEAQAQHIIKADDPDEILRVGYILESDLHVMEDQRPDARRGRKLTEAKGTKMATEKRQENALARRHTVIKLAGALLRMGCGRFKNGKPNASKLAELCTRDP